MNNDQNQQPPMNGNDDLAKTLHAGLQFEETPMGGTTSSPAPTNDDDMKLPSLAPDTDDNTSPEPPSLTPTPPTEDTASDDDYKNDSTEKPDEDEDEVTSDQPTAGLSSSSGSDLDDLKASALDDLRPLVGKLNLPAKERFDTLLLIIRSTDDQALLKQAHDAAKEIEDDTERAQALLDVIKEVDYFSNKR